MCEVLHEVERTQTWQSSVAPFTRYERPIVLEIGCHVGGSLAVWRECLNPRLLIGVQDTEELTVEEAERIGAERVIGRSQDSQTYESVISLLEENSVDFLYVDGDHTYEAVRHDWEM